MNVGQAPTVFITWSVHANHSSLHGQYSLISFQKIKPLLIVEHVQDDRVVGETDLCVCVCVCVPEIINV